MDLAAGGCRLSASVAVDQGGLCETFAEDRAAFSGACGAGRKRGIWQRRFWEHTICDERDYAAHVDYVHVNPLKHGYVERVADWPYSTFHRYVGDGAYPNDWAGEGVVDVEAGERA